MSTTTYTTSSDSLRNYVADVGHAACAFATTLFAAQERQLGAGDAASTKPSRRGIRGNRRVLSLANEYEAVWPSLSAELRKLA